MSRTSYFRDIQDQLEERAHEVRYGENPVQPEDFDDRPAWPDLIPLRLDDEPEQYRRR